MSETKRIFVRNNDEFWELCEELSRGDDYVALDVETNGLRPWHGDQIIGYSFYFPNTDTSYYVAVGHEMYGPKEDYDGNWNEHREWVAEWLGKNYPHPDTTYVAFNSKFDFHFMHLEGFEDPQLCEDVMVAAHILNENEGLDGKGPYQLKRLAGKYLGGWAVAGEIDLVEAAAEYRVDPKKEMWKLPAERVALYAMMDTEITWKLREFYAEALTKWDQWKLYTKRNEALLHAYLRMERNGFLLNRDTTQRHIDAIAPRMCDLKRELQEKAARVGLANFNPNAPAQVRTFARLNGQAIDSTGAEILEGLIHQGHTWAAQVLEYRKLSKANGSYYNPYLRHVDSAGYIHPTFNMARTVTGRMSSSDPNFQQIPRKDKEGDVNTLVKEVFVPTPGYVWVEIDYVNLEVFLASHFAKQADLQDLLRNDLDFHQYTADKMTQILGRKVERHQGKTYNFSLLYGMGAKTGAVKFGVSKPEAAEIVGAWRNVWFNIRRAYGTASKMAELYRHPDGILGGDYQFVRLMNGRTRKFHLHQKYGLKPKFYTAFNFLVQGTAGIVTEESITRVCKHFPDNRILRPVGAVHDSFIFELVDDEFLMGRLAIIKRLMEAWGDTFDPPLRVEVEISRKSWYDVEAVNV